MWADTIVLRVGHERDLLVGVQVDSDANASRVRTLFHQWIETNPPEVPHPFPAAFSLRLDPIDAPTGPNPGGLRAVPQLRHGATTIVRSRDPDDVLRAFAITLGGIHLGLDPREHIWVPLRPFIRNDSVVLVEVDTPTLVNDRLLGVDGIHEFAAWSVAVSGDRSARIPPPLPELAWHAIGVEPPVAEWQQFHLAGIVVHHPQPISTVDLVARLALKSIDATWFSLVAALAEQGDVCAADDGRELRQQVRRLLDGA